ncbi:MAG: tetratricopeptide repeat protein [Deltaproteobacteria bacterium]|nr:tetratricopeptide repeat protein [Deltaproteobacteria bacterium]
MPEDGSGRAAHEALEALNNRAWDWIDSERHSGALYIFEEGLPEAMRILGSGRGGHPALRTATVTVWHLGKCLLELDRPDEAAERLLEALGVAEKAPWDGDARRLGLLKLRELTGEALLATGDRGRAVDFFRDVLAVREGLLGPDDELTMESLVKLAGVLDRAGRLRDAAGCRPGSGGAPPPEPGAGDRASTEILVSEAVTIFCKGDYGTALELFESLQALADGKYGRDHPELAGLLRIAGPVRARAAGKVEIAIRKKEFEELEGSLGPEAAETLAALRLLGKALVDDGRHFEARRLLTEKLAETAWQSSGGGIACRGVLGEAILAGRDTSWAMSVNRGALGAAERRLGPEDPLTLTIADSLARCLAREALRSGRAGRCWPSGPKSDALLSEAEELLREAEGLLVRVVKGLKAAGGSGSPALASAAEWLADVRRLMSGP